MNRLDGMPLRDNTGGFERKRNKSFQSNAMQADYTLSDAFAAYRSTIEIPDWIFRQMKDIMHSISSWWCQFC